MADDEAEVLDNWEEQADSGVGVTWFSNKFIHTRVFTSVKAISEIFAARAHRQEI